MRSFIFAAIGFCEKQGGHLKTAKDAKDAESTTESAFFTNGTFPAENGAVPSFPEHILQNLMAARISSQIW